MELLWSTKYFEGNRQNYVFFYQIFFKYVIMGRLKRNLVKVSYSDYDVKKIANERPVNTVIDQW